jgi:hypothetical protein
MGKLVCSQQCLQSITFLPFSQNLSNKDKKNSEKKQKMKNEQPWTLTYTSVFQTMSSPLTFFFVGLDYLVFPPK